MNPPPPTRRPGRTARRDREREAHRREILEAAEQVFAKHGYEGATVEEIAREADFATGTLYNFFDGKEALFQAVADRILDDHLARYEAEIEPWRDDPARAIPRFVELRMQEVSRHEPFLHVFFPILRARRTARSDPWPDARYRRMLAQRARVVALFEQGVRRKLLHAAPAEELLGVVEGTIRFFVKHWNLVGAEVPIEERLALLHRTLIPLLMAHPEEPAP